MEKFYLNSINKFEFCEFMTQSSQYFYFVLLIHNSPFTLCLSLSLSLHELPYYRLLFLFLCLCFSFQKKHSLFKFLNINLLHINCTRLNLTLDYEIRINNLSLPQKNDKIIYKLKLSIHNILLMKY